MAVPFNIADFEPITGRVHQPPPVHQTFQARNFVVCSFVPRKFDYHPLAIPAPYNHSNINSDEVIYYVAGNFMSRRGVDIASFTVHPAGIPHGPHPGTAEASIGKEATEELAVMVDTFHPLRITRQAAELDDPAYPYSWLPPEDGGGRPPTWRSAGRRRSPTEGHRHRVVGRPGPAVLLVGEAQLGAPRPGARMPDWARTTAPMMRTAAERAGSGVEALAEQDRRHDDRVGGLDRADEGRLGRPDPLAPRRRTSGSR